MNHPINAVLERLSGVKRISGGWLARCPSHDDREPSLKVAEADDAGVLLHCHGGCRTEDVVAAMGLSMKDLFPQRQDQAHA